jgi:hypothetical protein
VVTVPEQGPDSCHMSHVGVLTRLAGPIKTMSYAIQASPWRPWRELVVFTGLIITAFVILSG